MTDSQGIQFLHWCLPRLHLRWPGFRKVRRQVYKRIERRFQELGIPALEAYQIYLEHNPSEWATLDTLCWIRISRFYRDRGVFQYVEHEILPQLAQLAFAQGESEICCWSAGCAGGEEPYTLAIIWKYCLAMRFPTLRLRIVATDIDPHAVQRAERGCYHASSVKELPTTWRDQVFFTMADELCLKDDYRSAVTFLVQDIRDRAPEGLFQLILCRNLVFTYFDEALERKTMSRLSAKLTAGGVLIIGARESVPDGSWGIEPWSTLHGVYRKL